MKRAIAFFVALLAGCTHRGKQANAVVPTPRVAPGGPPYTRIPDVGFPPLDPRYGMKASGIAYRDGAGKPWRMLLGPPSGKAVVIPFEPDGRCPPRTTPIHAQRFDPERICRGKMEIAACLPYVTVQEGTTTATCWYGDRGPVPRPAVWSHERGCWLGMACGQGAERDTPVVDLTVTVVDLTTTLVDPHGTIWVLDPQCILSVLPWPHASFTNGWNVWGGPPIRSCDPAGATP